MSGIRIGTRGSPLALAQAHMVRDRIAQTQAIAPDQIEIVAIKTTGDKIQDRPLSELGGKGLFTKEIELDLLGGQIDLAVHSMKDVPTVLPDGLVIEVLLEREDPSDAFISRIASSLSGLPQGAVVGSSSLRRQAQIKHQRPDLKVVDYRGNVETRLRKLDEGQVDATFLACAGLKRLGLAHEITAPVSPDIMLPAVAQGAIGLETRADDDRMRSLLAPLNHQDTAVCVAAERGFLAALDGSCRTPIAGLAEVDAGGIAFRGMIISPDGQTVHQTERQGQRGQAAALGQDAGAELKRRGGPNFFRQLQD